MGKLSPIESEFETAADAAAHDQWVRAKIAASLADQRPLVPHEIAMAELDALIAQAERGPSAR